MYHPGSAECVQESKNKGELDKTNPGGDADARARLAIEQGGTPNLAARGVWATYVENATGFFWNVRKEGTLRTWRALKREDDKLQAAARITAHEIFAECIKRDSLGGFQEGLKELDPGARMMAVRHVINAWRQYKADPRREELKRIRSIKDTELKRRAWQYLNEAQRFQD